MNLCFFGRGFISRGRAKFSKILRRVAHKVVGEGGGEGAVWQIYNFFCGRGGGAGKKGLAANVFKFFHDKCPLYMKIVFDESCISQAATRNSSMKISRQLRRTSYGQHCISSLASSVWNNLPNELKLCINLNTCKHKIKKWFLCKIRQKDKDIYLHD